MLIHFKIFNKYWNESELILKIFIMISNETKSWKFVIIVEGFFFNESTLFALPKMAQKLIFLDVLSINIL